MRKRDNGRQGIAAVEFALTVPVFAALLLLLAQGANAIHTYSTLVEASREGARHVLIKGDDADVEALISSLIGDIDKQNLTTTVTKDQDAGTVTVELSYDFSPFGDSDPNESEEESDDTLKFVAQTTMPLP